jgi:hypothetical protein
MVRLVSVPICLRETSRGILVPSGRNNIPVRQYIKKEHMSLLLQVSPMWYLSRHVFLETFCPYPFIATILRNIAISIIVTTDHQTWAYRPKDLKVSYCDRPGGRSNLLETGCLFDNRLTTFVLFSHIANNKTDNYYFTRYTTVC